MKYRIFYLSVQVFSSVACLVIYLCHYSIKFCLFIINLAYALLSRLSFVSLHPNRCSCLIFELLVWYPSSYKNTHYNGVQVDRSYSFCLILFTYVRVWEEIFSPPEVLDFQNKNVLNVCFQKLHLGVFVFLFVNNLR